MKMDRRSILFASLCAASFASAEWLRPRTPLQFKPSGSLDSTIPGEFGSWKSQYDPTLVVPPSEDSLAGQLYDDLLMRRYRDGTTGLEVFFLAAYGATQTDELQLHRPESCYPAVGLPITKRRRDALDYGKRTIPAVSLLSEIPGRIEQIFYWSRLADRFPTSAAEQREDKLDLAFAGKIPDGILVRLSTVRKSEDEAQADLKVFASGMLDAMNPTAKQTLIA